MIERLQLLPGDLRCCRVPTILTTILGSCVTVCLWDPSRGIGGMNHFVLPSDRGRSNNTRYGDVAMQQLAAGFTRLGCRLEDLLAKVFGGADVLPSAHGSSVGTNNIHFALALLQRVGIPVVAQRTGGNRGQHIVFHTGTGEVLMRFIPRTPITPLLVPGQTSGLRNGLERPIKLSVPSFRNQLFGFEPEQTGE
jgi:chemotaxis protein CheD